MPSVPDASTPADALQGWEAIRQSWEVIFANTDYMRFVITDALSR